jgi:hypothetical protein
MYDQGTARWMSMDPIGFDGGDPNLYRYVANNPITEPDPSGLRPAVTPSITACCKFDDGSEKWSETVSCPGFLGQTTAGCCSDRASGWFYDWKVVSSSYGPCPPPRPPEPNLYLHYLIPGHSAPADPAILNWGSEGCFCVAGAAGGLAAAGTEVTIYTAGCFRVLFRRLGTGIRRDPMHHGKPHGHWHFPWNW